MALSWTIESAISWDQYLRVDLIMPTGNPCSEMSKMWPALPGEPGGEAAEPVVVFQQQDLAAAPGQAVCAGQAGKAAADDDDVVAVVDPLEPVVSHETLQ